MWQPQALFNEYTLRTPVVLSGDESVRGLYNYPTTRIAVIHGSSFSDKKIFQETFSKRDIVFFKRSWDEEPSFNDINGTLHEIEDYKPDVIIAVGGGSVIDGSKIIRLLFEFPFYNNGDTCIPGEFLKTNFIAIPTTVGSGAEVSSAAVFYDEENIRKDMVVMHELQPDVVIYDKRYVMGQKTRLLVASALDAMAHILEGYVSLHNNTLMDIYAEKGFSLIKDELKKISDGNEANVDFQRLQYAGYYGGLVQNHCIVGAAHAIAHQLTHYGYSHGEAVALLLPYVIRFNARDKSVYERYNEIIRKSGLDSIEEVTDLIETSTSGVGIFDRIHELKSLLDELSNDKKFLDNVKQDKGGKGNPISITDEFIKEFIREI